MNKGFTLVELIAVITILGIIAIITTPAYESISTNIKTRNYNSKMTTIEAQTLSYVEKYFKNEVYSNTGGQSSKSRILCFSVQYLIRSGIISSDDDKEEYIKNDVTGEKYKGANTYIVRVSYDTSTLKLIADEEIGKTHTENCNINDMSGI